MDLLPVRIEVFGVEAVVVFVADFRLLEWEEAHDYYENDDTSGEDVCLSTVIWLIQFDLRSHVGFGTAVGAEEFASGLMGCEAEVSNLQVHLLVK